MAEVFVELDDGGALEHLEECYLSMRRLFFLAIHVEKVNFFEGVLFPIYDVLVQVHCAGCTLANRPNFLVFSKAG